MDVLRNKILDFINRGEDIVKNTKPLAKDFAFPSVSGPEYELWMSEINITNERDLKNHPLYQSIHRNCFHKTKKISDVQEMIGFLKAIYDDDVFWNERSILKETPDNPIANLFDHNSTSVVSRVKDKKISMNNKVFIVHGHDELAKITVARSLEKMGFEAIILHEQPDEGKTIIEKIEVHSDVAFAVVLYTECDVGRDKTKSESENKNRARQNVVFEHGYLIGKLGRNRVCALVKGDVETPGDISGVVYTPMDYGNTWEISLYKNMKAVGINVDMNKL